MNAMDTTGGSDCDANGEDDSDDDDDDNDGIPDVMSTPLGDHCDSRRTPIDPCDPDDDGDGIPDECDVDLPAMPTVKMTRVRTTKTAMVKSIACDTDDDGDGIPE